VTVPAFLEELKQKYLWLQDLRLSLDDVLVEAYALWQKSGSSAFNTYAVEEHLADVSDLLDRCLVYRKDYNDLMGAAIQRALDHDQWTKQRSVRRDIELAHWSVEKLELEVVGQEAVAVAFRKGDDDLAEGFATAAQEGANATRAAAKGETTREKLVKQRWRQDEQFQALLQELHATPGHPLNFAQRGGQMLVFLLEDYVSALAKASAAAKGIAAFGLSYPLDLSQSSTPLDDLVRWTREVIDAVQEVKRQDFLYTHIIRIEPPSDVEIKAINIGSTFRITLPDVGNVTLDGKPRQILNARAVAIGAAVIVRMHADAVHYVDFYRAQLAVEPNGGDPQVDALDQPIVMDDISVSRAGSVKMYTPSILVNLPVSSGTAWSGWMLPGPRSGSRFIEFGGDFFRGVEIHLTVAGQLTENGALVVPHRNLRGAEVDGFIDKFRRP
jgi:hypothetical protein